jgi:hypothetical protein
MANKIISEVKDNPKTRIGWWAFYLSIFTIAGGPILGVFAAVISPLLQRTLSEKTGSIIGFSLGIVVILIFIITLILSIVAFKKGERSWAVWTALILSILEACFWVFMIVGELVFPH